MSSESSIACDLSALEEDERMEHRDTAEVVFEAIEEHRELPDGYAFRLPSDTQIITYAGAFISRERLCCPFFNFTLEVTPEQGPVWLKLTGREGVKEYVEEAVLSYWDFEEEPRQPVS